MFGKYLNLTRIICTSLKAVCEKSGPVPQNLSGSGIGLYADRFCGTGSETERSVVSLLFVCEIHCIIALLAGGIDTGYEHYLVAVGAF